MPNPCPHTMLINSAIGFCKKDDSWIHPLADLKYKAELVEQTIPTEESGKIVRPDVVATSKKLNHSVVIECKSKNPLNITQISKYRLLKPSDISRWIRVYDPNQHKHDICLLIYETRAAALLDEIDIPVLILSDIVLTKRNKFFEQQLDQKFGKPISTVGLIPPISYYPFSEIDDRRIVIPHALRAIQLIIDVSVDKIDITNPKSYVTDTIMNKIYRVWDIVSVRQQNALKSKVIEVIKYLLRTYPDLKHFLKNTSVIKKRDTVKLVSLDGICAKIQQAEVRSTLDDFPT